MFHQNQLQFNLDVPSMPNNLAARYRNPGPLVIEKLGSGGVAAKNETGSSQPKESPIKFTAISEDRLSTALRLAKHDLKNILAKKQTLDDNEPPRQEQKQARKSKTKRSLSGKSHHHLRDANLRIQERYANPNENRRSIQTQTPVAKRRHAKNIHLSGPGVAYGLVLNAQLQNQPDVNREGRSNRVALSPPSKDVALSPNSQQAKEIRRLRSELKTYMKKVEELSVKASQQRMENTKDEEGTEEDPRRAARAAEHASRSARLLYSLQQQVREIQEELDKLGPGKVRHTKKSRALNRLAAAHRGAVRALQSFLHHLPSEMDPSRGLPPHYQELALLIRQLSLCCSQLDVEESGIPEGVLNILEQAQDFQDALSRQIPSPPRPKPKEVSQPYPSPRRRLAFESNAIRVPSGKPQQRVAITKSQPVDRRDPKVPHPHQYKVRETPVKDTQRHSDTPHATPGPTTVERLRQTVGNKATPGSPERNEALRAGLEALLRAGGHSRGPPQPARLTSRAPNLRAPGPPPAPRAHRQLPGKGPSAAPASKSLILPAQLKAARERLRRAPTIPRDAHFTQETVASKLKHRDPAGQGSGIGPGIGPQAQAEATAPKPAWTPPGSPWSFHKVVSPRPQPVASSSEDEEESVKADREHSPRRRKVIFDLEKESQDRGDAGRNGGKKLDAGLMQREIARQAWLDREAAKQMKHQDAGPVSDGYPPIPHQWLEKAERALTDRLRPLIDKAETIAKELQYSQNSTRQSLHHQLSQRAVRATSNNADLLSDLLLEDVLADTAVELQRIERDKSLERQARQLQDAPTVEGMLQSLEKMELVEDEIRRRWKRVEYIDQREVHGDSIQQKEGRWMMGTPLDGDFLESFPGDIPTSHTSMQFTNSGPQDNKDSRPSIPSSERHSDARIPPQRDDIKIHSSKDEDNYDSHQPPRDNVTNSMVESGDEKRYLPQETERPLSPASGARIQPSHHLNILHNLLDYNASSASRQKPRPTPLTRDSARPTLNRPKFSLFIPTDMMNHIKDHRGRFEHHLKRTSHWAYGTFDPWKLVEELADEVVSEIIADVSSEVGDILNHCVDDLYKAEFDMT